MNAEILSIGTELLMGQITNTNAQYIASMLPEVGIGVYWQSVVGDNPLRLKEAMEVAIKRSDVVITTGGLGPTKDDLTKETAAEVLGIKLVTDRKTLEELDSYFKKVNRTMTKNNLKQANIPEGCTIIRNSNGTAPGCIVEKEGKTVILLPGPPREMCPMFNETVIPYLLKKTDTHLYSKYLRIFGIGESAMEEKIIDLVESQSNPTLAPYAKEGEVMLRVTARYNKDEDPEIAIRPLLDRIYDRIGEYIYCDDNSEMEEVLVRLLKKYNITISIAESCTGGMISERITRIPGVSAVFTGGVVAYNNTVKSKTLNVSDEILKEYGSVSAETAEAMAVSIRNMTGSDISLSVTGIAGPGGATETKPLGSVFIALADGKSKFSQKLQLWGDRARIRNVTALHAMNMARKYLIENYGDI
ncbi:MAG: competence/damage-inducible protein A [Eubacteriales bacterium]|nr:competence/damage-inducible protein A [Eubacteriales bacterium]